MKSTGMVQVQQTISGAWMGHLHQTVVLLESGFNWYYTELKMELKLGNNSYHTGMIQVQHWRSYLDYVVIIYGPGYSVVISGEATV